MGIQRIHLLYMGIMMMSILVSLVFIYRSDAKGGEDEIYEYDVNVTIIDTHDSIPSSHPYPPINRGAIIYPQYVEYINKLIDVDIQRMGSCKRKDVIMTIFQSGDPWGCMPLKNHGCESNCYLINNINEAKGIFFHVLTAPVPIKSFSSQKVMAFGAEPRLNGGEPIWGYSVRSGSDAIMTYNYDSNLPQVTLFPDYYDRIHDFVPTRENFDSRKFMIFVSSNCVPERTAMAQELMTYLPNIEARGKCLQNAPPLPGSMESNPLTYSEYKFVLGIEKVKDQDYVTEKFVFGFLAHSVPVYHGSRSARLMAPGNNSYIDVADFPSIRDLADYLIEVGTDYSKWVTYFEFLKSNNPPILPWQRHQSSWTADSESGLCRVCDCLCDDTCSTHPNPGNGIPLDL